MIIPVDMVLPARTVRGAGCVQQVLGLGRGFGARGMVLYGRSFVLAARLDLLGIETGGSVLPWRYAGGEPTVEGVEDLLSVARGHGVDWIAGIGGGSVLDAAKAVAGLYHAPLAVAAYHQGQTLEGGGVPFLAIPTTAGSGSEATMVAVLSDCGSRVKRSIRHPHFTARVVCLDPQLLGCTPQRVVAHSGMDALAQAVESYLSRNASAFTDAMALEALRLILRYVPALYADSENMEAAEGMQIGSYLAGIALSGARLGVIHGLAHPVGMQAELPHGQVCGMCLPMALHFNRPAVPERLETLDALAGGSLDARVAELMAQFDIAETIAAPFPENADVMIAEVLSSGSTAANPRPVCRADARAMLEALYAGTRGQDKERSA